MSSYHFIGHDTVASYVGRQLGDWEYLDDVAHADVVLTYCTHASAIEDAYFDDNGIIKRAKKGALLIDLSPSTPSLSREISAVATVNDLKAVEAPLAVLEPTSADAFGSSDNFVCYVSGEGDDVLAAREVLDELAGLVKCTGASGSAQLAKASHTLQLCAQLMAVVEADALRRVVESNYTSIKVQGADIEPLTSISAHAMEAIRSERFEGAFTVEMMMGDVVAAMTAADDVELILPQLEAAMHLLEVLAVIGGAEKSPAALSLIYRDEETSAKAGLDWTRAENLFVDDDGHHDHAHEQGLLSDYDDFDDYDDYDDGFDDGYDFGIGGFGRYSAN